MKKFNFIFALMATTIISTNAWAVIASGTDCGDNCSWSISDDGVLTITGTGINGSGTMYNYNWYDDNYNSISRNANKTPWDSYNNSIKSVNISEGFSSIGYNAFYGMNNLTEIVIPDGLSPTGNYIKKRADKHTFEDDFDDAYLKSELGFTDEEIVAGHKYFNGPHEYYYYVTEAYNTLDDVDLNTVTIKCSGDSKKCKKNLDNSGLTGYKLVDKDGKELSSVDDTPVELYTVSTATARVNELGGCEDVKCSLKMWFK